MDLQYVQLDDKWFMLTEDLHFNFTLAGINVDNSFFLRKIIAATGMSPDEELTITVPKGFVCDLASIPSALQWLFKPDGSYAPAAALHDFLYQNNHKGRYAETPIGKLNANIGKFFADRIFLLAMEALDVNGFVSTIFYDSVRIFGEDAYDDLNKNDKYPTPPSIVYYVDESYMFIRQERTVGIPDADTALTGKRTNVHISYPNLKRDIIKNGEPKDVPS